uniref:Bardet-Biedl syndrome 5 protein homolog n=1 Tax=Trichuris muris TaxID=70415 RepID=A0A5S6QIF1_TRIMR
MSRRDSLKYDVLWEDRCIQFDLDLKLLKLRNGEFIVEKSHGVEDTKGSCGQKGTLVITNLRIIWFAHASYKINLSIGFNTVTGIRTRSNLSKLLGKTESLYVLTKSDSTRFEFIFSTFNHVNSKLFASVLLVYRAYETSTLYREVRMRSSIVVHDKLRLLPLEEQQKRVDGVWNLYSDEGDLGSFIITNIRLVWFATMNEMISISMPYLHMKSCKVKNSKFGPVLVIETSIQSGNHTFGFRVDPRDRLDDVCRQLINMSAAYHANPIFGVEITRSQESSQCLPKVAAEDDVEIDTTIGRADALTAYFAYGQPNGKEGAPVYSEELGVAIESLKDGFTLKDLWELNID